MWWAGLFLLACLYFAASWNLSMELMDQGQLLYPSWRVAEGAIPLRDFPHMYGPALFLWLGALLRVFGPDVLVVRICLILLKAVIALLAYVWSCRIMSRPMALGVFALNVAVLGTPWWLFNTPYPNHFALALNLAGFLALLAYRERPVRGALLAGVCFGVAVTFKQTLGVFALVALAWFALYQRHEPLAGRAASDNRRPMSAALAMRLLVLAASLVMFVLYTAKQVDLWTNAVLLGPVFGTVGALIMRERRDPPTAADQARTLQMLIAAAVGLAIPVGACVAFYLAIGGLHDLVFSMFTVPAAMVWFVPFPIPALRTILLATAAGALAVAVSVPNSGRNPAPRRFTAAVAWAVGLLAMVLFAWRLQRAEGLAAHVRSGAWVGELFALVFVLPMVSLWLGVLDLLSARPSASGADGIVQTRARVIADDAVLLLLYGVVAWPHLYPAADFWHLVNMLPPYFILFGWHLDRLWSRAPTTGRTPVLARVIAATFVVVMVLPFVNTLVQARLDRPTPTASMTRATGVFDPSPKFHAAADLVAYLASPAQTDRQLVVLANEQMLYFLAAKPSAWEGREFLLYGTEAGLFPPETARALIDEDELLRALDEKRPLLIDFGDGTASRRLWAAFPRVARQVEAQYRPVERFGEYVVLDVVPGTGSATVN